MFHLKATCFKQIEFNFNVCFRFSKNMGGGTVCMELLDNKSKASNYLAWSKLGTKRSDSNILQKKKKVYKLQDLTHYLKKRMELFVYQIPKHFLKSWQSQ